MIVGPEQRAILVVSKVFLFNDSLFKSLNLGTGINYFDRSMCKFNLVSSLNLKERWLYVLC